MSKNTKKSNYIKPGSKENYIYDLEKFYKENGYPSNKTASKSKKEKQIADEYNEFNLIL